MGFETVPSLVLSNIFSHLSPGFLWIFCRRVCKSWKFEVEHGDSLYDGIYRKCLLQFWVHKVLTSRHIEDDLQIYRCTKYDMSKGTVTFQPLEGMSPCTLKNQTISYPRTMGLMKYDSIHIGQITSSLFPGGKPPCPNVGLQRCDPKYHAIVGKTLVYDNPIGRTSSQNSYITLSHEIIEEFRNREMEIHSSVRYHCFSNHTGRFPLELRFNKPKEYVEILYGPYIFKCHYLTQMISASPDPEDIDDKWYEIYVLVVNEIEVPISSLCKW